MFIVFYIFIAHIYTNSVHSFTLRTKDDENVENDNLRRYNIFEGSNKNEQSTQSDLLKFIQNLTNVKQQPNLKSNVFDRMLSEEMFSIKEHFQKKDMTEVSPVHVTTRSYRAKPTLEIKQQWPVLKRIAKLDEEELQDDEEIGKKSSNSKIIKDSKKDHSKKDNISKDELLLEKPKSLGLRSLPSNQRLAQTNHNKCVCQRSTERIVTDSILRHNSPNGLNAVHTKCTSSSHCDSSSSEALAYYPMAMPIFTVPPYVIDLGEIPNNPSNAGPKRGKQKHRGSNNKYKDRIYYDEYSYDGSDSSDSKPSDDETDNYDVSGVDENLVNSIVNDLGVYHRDSVLKKCYCSSIGKALPDYLSILFIFIYLLKVWLLGI